jgi:hypothetical protein
MENSNISKITYTEDKYAREKRRLFYDDDVENFK